MKWSSMNTPLIPVYESTAWFYDILAGFFVCLFFIFLLYVFSLVLNLIYSKIRKEEIVWDKDHIFKKRSGVLLFLLGSTTFSVLRGFYSLLTLHSQNNTSNIVISSTALILLFVIEFKTLKEELKR